MESDREQWEFSKENIQPLRQGRKIAHLQAALNMDAAQHAQISEQKHKFESELRTYSGNDPLDVWYQYIHWVEQHYPKGGKDGNLFELVQKCCSTFQHDERYTSDPRYLNVWLKLADIVVDSLEIYNFIFANNLCCDLAEFYIRWAMELEKTGNYPRADAIFQEGVNRKAKPLEDLQAHYRQFLARVVKIRPNQEGNSVESQRLALSALKTQGRTQHVPNNRVEAQAAATPGPFHVTSRKPASGQLQKTPVFSIYQGHTTPNLLPSKTNYATPLPVPQEQVKENVLSPGKWSNAKLKQKHTPVVPISALENLKPAFEVHNDKLHPPAVTPRQIPELCGPLSEKKLPKQPSLFVQSAADSNPLMKVQYCKEKIYRGGEETSFEEIRAARYMKKQNEKKQMEEAVAQQIKTAMEHWWQQKYGHVEQMLQQVVQAVPKSLNSSEATDSSKLTSVTLPPHLQGVLNADFSLQTCKLEPNSRSEESLLAMNNSVGSCNHSETGRAPSPTLHTKEAMKTTMALFNKSLHLSGDSFEETTTNGKELVSDGRLPQLTNAPFTIFAGGGPEDAPCVAAYSKTEEDCENKENVQPPTYIQQHSNRQLAGTLQPSTNIQFIPLEEQHHEMNDEQDCFDDVVPLSNSKADDFTFAAPRNSSAFAAMVKNVSTPLPQVTDVEPMDTGCEVQLPEQTFCDDSARYPNAKGQDTWKSNACLSAIPEISDEASGSSSSSSSAGLQSTTQHSQHQKEPRKNICQLFEKMNLKDLDPFSPLVRQWALENWAVKYSTAERIYIKNVTFLNCKMPCIRNNAVITFGDKAQYTIAKKLGEGAYARIYRAVPENSQGHERSSVNTDVVLKVEQPSCLWEFFITAVLEERLQKYSTSLETMGGIIQFKHAYIYDDGSVLVTELFKLGTLLDVINAYKKKNVSIPECLVLYFTVELLFILENMHRCNIIHADFKPDNILVKTLPRFKPTDRNINDIFSETATSLVLIDLGRSIDIDTYPPGAAFYRKIETQDFVCTEMKESRPWTFQVDYYGLLATVHCLLFGTYMKVSKVNGIWKLNGAFKRYWQTHIWQAFFHEFLNVPSCQQLPDLHAWRIKFQNAFVEADCYKTFSAKVFEFYQLCSVKGY